jgi:hypothetical protein
MKCVLSPGGARNTFTFDASEKPSPSEVDQRLFAFERVKGSKVGDLFPTFRAAAEEGSVLYHLHHASRVVAEVLDPGEWPNVPSAPWWDASQQLPLKGFPKAPFAVVSGLDSPSAPRIDEPPRHFMAHLLKFNRNADDFFFPSSTKRDTVGGGPEWGTLPDLAPVILVEKIAPPSRTPPQSPARPPPASAGRRTSERSLIAFWLTTPTATSPAFEPTSFGHETPTKSSTHATPTASSNAGSSRGPKAATPKRGTSKVRSRLHESHRPKPGA